MVGYVAIGIAISILLATAFRCQLQSLMATVQTSALLGKNHAWRDENKTGSPFIKHVTMPFMRNKGFTLLELAIVIVIIGLIVAGISAGQSLVSAAKARSVISESEQYKLAFNNFRLQYGHNSFPGDFDQANSYWPGCGVGAAEADCNGDGDSLISRSSTADDSEQLRAWQHLSLAGLITALM